MNFFGIFSGWMDNNTVYKDFLILICIQMNNKEMQN